MNLMTAQRPACRRGIRLLPGTRHWSRYGLNIYNLQTHGTIIKNILSYNEKLERWYLLNGFRFRMELELDGFRELSAELGPAAHNAPSRSTALNVGQQPTAW